MTGETFVGVLAFALLLIIACCWVDWNLRRTAAHIADVAAVEDRYETSGFAPTGLDCHDECRMAATLAAIRALPEVQG